VSGSADAKVEGRKSLVEIDQLENGGRMVALAQKLRRKARKGGRRSLQAISVDLVKVGFKSSTGKPFAPTAVARMLGELR
jgi:hypothetical protein